MRATIGSPVASPSEMPSENSTRSASWRWVVTSLCPGRRRSSCAWTKGSSIRMPAWSPSIVQPTNGPWLVPKIVVRYRAPKTFIRPPREGPRGLACRRGTTDTRRGSTRDPRCPPRRPLRDRRLRRPPGCDCRPWARAHVEACAGHVPARDRGRARRERRGREVPGNLQACGPVCPPAGDKVRALVHYDVHAERTDHLPGHLDIRLRAPGGKDSDFGPIPCERTGDKKTREKLGADGAGQRDTATT